MPTRIEVKGKSAGGSSCLYRPNNNICGLWPSNLQECYEECAYQYGRDIEACSRLKDKKKKPACYEKANQDHANCRRACEKKFKKE